MIHIINYKMRPRLCCILLLFTCGCNLVYDGETVGHIYDSSYPSLDEKYAFNVQFEYNGICYYSTFYCSQILPCGFPVPIVFRSKNPSRNRVDWGTSVLYNDRYYVKYERPVHKITMYLHDNDGN